MASTSLTNFVPAIEKLLETYVEDVSGALEEGLDKSSNILTEALKSASPRGTGDYAEHWKAGDSGKGYRIVKNDKQVSWNGKQTPLAGILEYSTKHSKPHIEQTKKASRSKILKTLKDAIKQSGKQ